ncbi:MAG: RluA family pseudouridine synthase [Aquabacterium sp.]|nr:MAG: RluA family pseudouridine synthase [Aquabacterium sp.]
MRPRPLRPSTVSAVSDTASPTVPVVHADAQLLVLDKPSGLLSVPGRGPQNQDCLSARAQRAWPDALVVHRLDMSTSGLIVMGRGTDAQRRLSMAFERRLVHKRYVAVVDGLVDADSGEVGLPLICDWPNRPRQMVDHDRGKPALTRWRVLSRDEATGSTRVELEPVTGRSHQLRVHLQALGHPILGDEFYAHPAAHARSPRLLLHASRITLPHPATGEEASFESPPPF